MHWQKLCFPGSKAVVQIWGLLWHLSGWGGGEGLQTSNQALPALLHLRAEKLALLKAERE